MASGNTGSLEGEEPLAVVLASGGMDSCVAAAIVAREYRLAFLHVCYGQRTEAREKRAFLEIADWIGAYRKLLIRFEHLATIGGSSLTDRTIPFESGEPGREIPRSYVPFRNANLLSAAVSWGEVIGASAVVIGAVEEDSSGYPDCRREFYDAFQEVVRRGTRPETWLKILTPVIGMSKAEIVRVGVEFNAPLHLTWSCYEREDVPCGVCASCVLRLRGFRIAGIRDPLPYPDLHSTTK
jgi:7-cyano-7-deazaguanine synthase